MRGDVSPDTRPKFSASNKVVDGEALRELNRFEDNSQHNTFKGWQTGWWVGRQARRHTQAPSLEECLLGC